MFYVILGFIIIPSILFVIIFAISSPKTEKLNVRGIEVEIIGERNDNVEKYVENINYIDDYLIELPNRIILTDESISSIMNQDVPDANAVTIPEEMSVYINTASYDSLTMAHEFFHLLDIKLGDISNQKDFQTMIDSNKELLQLNEYQLSNYQEAFVGCMLLYRYQPEELEECQEVFQFVENIINRYNDIKKEQ